MATNATQEELFGIGLPKWPALIVQGQFVTPAQAKEIIVRTDSMQFSSNDHEFDRQLNEAFYDVTVPIGGWREAERAIAAKLGLPNPEDDMGTFRDVWEYKERYKDMTGQLELQYLNNSRIVSSWIGGPHGWCHWDGTISCNNYNIGKWPSVEEVFNEWQQIAAAFPFLDLRCQLLNHEGGCPEGADEPGPVVEYRVQNGQVEIRRPEKPLAASVPADDIALMAMLEKRFSSRDGERGCTIEMFKDAVAHTRAVVAERAAQAAAAQ